MPTYRHALHSAATAAEVADALRAELREWRESLLPPGLRNAGVIQVTGEVDAHSFVFRYDAYPVRGRPLDDVELRGRLTHDTGKRGTIVKATLHHDDGLATMLVVWLVVLVAIGWFSLTGAFVTLVMGSAFALHAWWLAQKAKGLVSLQRRYLMERLEHALRAAEQASEVRDATG